VFTRHIRDGHELPELNRDNHYSTHFQEIRSLKQQVRILPVSEGRACNSRTQARKICSLTALFLRFHSSGMWHLEGPGCAFIFSIEESRRLDFLTIKMKAQPGPSKCEQLLGKYAHNISSM
jgi:hypothetical protein